MLNIHKKLSNLKEYTQKNLTLRWEKKAIKYSKTGNLEEISSVHIKSVVLWVEHSGVTVHSNGVGTREIHYLGRGFTH